MKRIHPFLAIALVALAVVLVTLALAAGAQAQEVVVSIPPRAPIGTVWAPEPETFPAVNGFPIRPGSPECPRKTDRNYVPYRDRVEAIKAKTLHFIYSDILEGKLVPKVSMETTLKVLDLMRQTEPRFYDRALYGTYQTPPGWTPTCGIYWCGCAQGVSLWPPQIATDDPARTEALVAWEYANSAVCWLERCDLGDSTYISSVNSRVRDWIGGWKQE